MDRLAAILILFLSLIPLRAYTPPVEIFGDVVSVRTMKRLPIKDIPAGELDEPWFINGDYDEEGRLVSQWYFHLGQEVRRHEFRYETDINGNERTTWVTYYLTPDLRPPAERLAGYELWYTLSEGQSIDETHFETVQNHPVKTIYRYYDEQGRLVKEEDTLADLDIELTWLEGRLVRKWGYRGDRIFWEDRYLYDQEGRVIHFIQSDLNTQIYQQGNYIYEGDRVIFEKYILDHPIDLERDTQPPLEGPTFRSVKSYNGSGQLVELENYNWNGPSGLILTEKNVYTYDEKGYLSRVEEVYRQKVWEMTYDDRGNWVTLQYTYIPPLRGETERSFWFRKFEYP